MTLADGVYARFLSEFAGDPRAGFRAVTITVRFADFTTFTRSVTLPEPASAGAAARATLRFQALRLFMPFLDRRENPRGKSIRLLGVRVEKIG